MNVIYSDHNRLVAALAIYICTPKAYENFVERQQQKHFDATYGEISKRDDQYTISDDDRRSIYSSFYQRHLGPWKYNQIIGWIELLRSGRMTLKGELWMVDNHRSVRKDSKRRIRYQGKVFELVLSQDSNVRMFQELVTEIRQRIRNSSFAKGRFVDLTQLEIIGPHVAWNELLV